MNKLIFAFLAISALVMIVSADATPGCVNGEVKHQDCNSCTCANNVWVCTVRLCVPLRQKRDLESTPCAPNDYFKIDCNTCYCNIEKTGYLCTKNLCSFNATSTTVGNLTGDKEYQKYLCLAGQKFSNPCNECICTQDRQRVVCRQKPCA